MSKVFLQKLRMAASEADDLLTSFDASDLVDELEVARDFMFEAANMIEELESRLAQTERERDALHNDLKLAIYRGRSFNLDCEFCKDKEKPTCEDCRWQWRGVCPENTKEG